MLKIGEVVRNGFAVAIAGLLFACGEPPCERAQKSTTRLKELSRDCAVTPSEFDLDKCVEQISECSATELDALEAVYACRDGIDQCVAGKESDWIAKVLGCASPFNEVSESCRSAFAGSR